MFIDWRNTMLAFIHGFVLALGLILPLGVQNVFIFNQGAVQPRFYKALPAILALRFAMPR
jgi:L-lysine exporter family protein LysE/ArgO